MSGEQGAPVENSDNINADINADTIIKTIETLNNKVTEATKTAEANLEKLRNLLEKSGVDAKKQTEQITKLQSEIAELNRSNATLSEKAKGLTEINTKIQELDKNINALIQNNEQITNTFEQSGGFQYNKKHPKHKRPFRLFSRSNSKTTSKKSKKRRRRPGKSVKKGGMKTRRRRNKKSKKSKKRRK